MFPYSFESFHTEVPVIIVTLSSNRDPVYNGHASQHRSPD